MAKMGIGEIASPCDIGGNADRAKQPMSLK